MTDAPRRVIDVHAHHVSPALVDAVQRHGGDYGAQIRRTDDGLPYLVFADGPTIRPFFPDLWDLDRRVQRLVPAYMTMGQSGMGDMAEGFLVRPDKTAGSIQFVKVGGNWKIASM